MAGPASQGLGGPAAAALALVLSVSLLSGVPVAEAHSGHGKDPRPIDGGVRLEGEYYDDPEMFCDSGEHTQVKSDSSASMGEKVFIPSSGCAAFFYDVPLVKPLHLARTRIGISGTAGNFDTEYTYRIEVYVDGDLFDDTTFTRTQNDGWTTHRFPDIPKLDGVHDIQAEFEVVQGEWYHNVVIDYIDFVEKCENNPPTATIETDALGDGSHAWTDRSYTFWANASDPDDHDLDGEGDPVNVTWTFPDGTTATGEQVTHSFASNDATANGTETRTVQVELEDDPEPRCGLRIAPSETTTLTHDVTVGDGLSPALQDLGPDRSCTNGTVVDSWTSVDVIGNECHLAAEPGFGDAGPDLLNASAILVDGEVLFEGPGAANGTYDAANWSDGPHTLQVCGDAVGDKYDRHFCGPEWNYEDRDCTNAPPRVETISANGMADGFVGWTKRTYAFQAQEVVDPEGDPVSVSWSWPTGSTSQGASVTKSFFIEGDRSFEVEASDDPAARCPSAATGSTTTPGTFKAVQEFRVLLVQPRPGESCVEGFYYPTVGPDDTMAGACPVAATASVSHAFDQLVPVFQGALQLDGTPFHEEEGHQSIQGIYYSSQYTTSLHTISACFEVEGDVHDRIVCDNNEIFNIGR